MIKRRTSATIALVLSKEEIVALVVAAGVLFAILPMVQARSAVEKLLEDIITVPEQAYLSIEKRYAVRLQITEQRRRERNAFGLCLIGLALVVFGKRHDGMCNIS